MSAGTRGRALIINNYKFDNQSNREGAIADQRNITTLFQDLQFEVELRANLTVEVRNEIIWCRILKLYYFVRLSCKVQYALNVKPPCSC